VQSQENTGHEAKDAHPSRHPHAQEAKSSRSIDDENLA
jgi:hypothetical protein